jgi:threonine/homoserine/homoserine lactone efflux protein
MNAELYVAFVLATTVMILLPGPTVMLTIGHSMAFGARRATLTVAGAVCGIAVQLGVTLIGMTSFLLLMADWFDLLRWAGVAYLLYLGVQQWRAGNGDGAAEAPAAKSGRSLFTQGMVVTIANPKSMIFLAAFFPQFVDPASPLALQLTVMGASFLVITFVFTWLWALPAARAGSWFRDSRRGRLRNRVSGALMIAAAAGLALTRRA